MRGVLRAVGRILAAMAIVTTIWCEKLGRFVAKCLPGNPTTDPGMIEDGYAAAAETAPVSPKLDEKIAGIQLAANALVRNQKVTAAMLKGLSPKTLRWLQVLDDDMLATVGNARPSDLAGHLSLRKSLRGVLRFEDDAIAEYQRIVEAQAQKPKAPRPASRRAPDDEMNFAAAFG